VASRAGDAGAGSKRTIALDFADARTRVAVHADQPKRFAREGWPQPRRMRSRTVSATCVTLTRVNHKSRDLC
jgi:hypothetical protein